MTVAEAGGAELWAVAESPADGPERISTPVLPPEAGALNPVALSVDLDAGLPLGEVVSHHHVVVREDGPGTALRISLADGPVPANRDFELTWRLDLESVEAAVFHQDLGNETYLMVLLGPPRRNAR